jgi:hypothetical protein
MRGHLQASAHEDVEQGKACGHVVDNHNHLVRAAAKHPVVTALGPAVGHHPAVPRLLHLRVIPPPAVQTEAQEHSTLETSSHCAGQNEQAKAGVDPDIMFSPPPHQVPAAVTHTGNNAACIRPGATRVGSNDSIALQPVLPGLCWILLAPANRCSIP